MEQNKTELQHQKKLLAHIVRHSCFPYSSYMMHQRKVQSLHGQNVLLPCTMLRRWIPALAESNFCPEIATVNLMS